MGRGTKSMMSLNRNASSLEVDPFKVTRRELLRRMRRVGSTKAKPSGVPSSELEISSILCVYKRIIINIESNRYNH